MENKKDVEEAVLQKKKAYFSHLTTDAFYVRADVYKPALQLPALFCVLIILPFLPSSFPLLEIYWRGRKDVWFFGYDERVW